MSTRSIGVLVADDHSAIREALQVLVDSQPDMRIVGAACNGAMAVQLAPLQLPDVVVLDVSMPELDGIESACRILQHLPQTKILIVSGNEKQDCIKKATGCGAHGFVSKEHSLMIVPKAIREIINGAAFVCF